MAKLNFILLCAFLTFVSINLVKCEENQVTVLTYRNLQKAVSNFKAVLVKFDESYPSRFDLDKQYKQTAQDYRFTKDVLIAEIKVPSRGSDIKDEDITEERRFAEKLNSANNEDLPAVYLFKQGQFENPIKFAQKDFDANSLRQFIRQQEPTVRPLLESCIEALDNLAQKFVGNASQRKTLLKEAETQVQKLADDAKQSGKVYLKVMEKVIERGEMFLKSEYERVKNLLADKMSDLKKKQLQVRLNILESFHSVVGGKEEL